VRHAVQKAGKRVGAFFVGTGLGVDDAGAELCLEHGVGPSNDLNILSETCMRLLKKCHKRDFTGIQLRYTYVK